MTLEGVSLDAFIAGLMAASFITFWLDTVDNIPKAASAILFSGLLAGISAPVASVYVIGAFPILAGAGNALPLLCAVLVGSSVTWGFPILINYFKTNWGKSNV